jgi:hypothetical protein
LKLSLITMNELRVWQSWITDSNILRAALVLSACKSLVMSAIFRARISKVSKAETLALLLSALPKALDKPKT